MKECFENEISWIHSKSIQQFARYCVDNLPDYFFMVPASSSGKYHPSYALGDGGLVRHTKAAVAVAHELFNLEMFQKQFSDTEQDLILLSLILHDGKKQGGGNGKHTVFEHPLYAADFVKECNFECFYSLLRRTLCYVVWHGVLFLFEPILCIFSLTFFSPPCHIIF